jgi:O-antigen ligase
MIRDAWREYMDHPWLGSSIVERNALIYPHNAMVEAFMATGTFGGSAFALLILAAIYRAMKFIRRDPATAWIPVCFFQQLIGAMFSGGLYGNVPLWAMMAIVLGADLPRTPPPLPARPVPSS